MEAFLPPYGWVSFDVSETQNLLGAVAKSADYNDEAKAKMSAYVKDHLVKGYRDNTWYVQTHGSDYELEPKAARRAAVVRTAYIEADGEELPDCDAANKTQRMYSWMTVHKYTPDRDVKYPFKDLKSLEGK